ncbi:MAG: four helix bundle protein [Terriglobales bacterium]
MSGSYRDLVAWQKAMELVYRIYELTKKFPSDEKYGLVSQLRRAAVSIPSNIAEGKGRRSDTDMCRFFNTARGSLHEVETQILIAAHLEYITATENQAISAQIAEVARILNGLIHTFEAARA